MAYSETIKLVANDTLPQLGIKLKDSNSGVAGTVYDPDDADTWAPIDVTGANVRLKIREIGSSALKATLICTVANGAEGKVITDFPAGTLDKAGQFEAEVEVNFANGGVQTVQDLIKFIVRMDF